MKKIIDKFKEVYGKPVFHLRILFIRIFSVTKTCAEHYNIYILYIPVFRIIKSKTKLAINLLIFTWMYKLWLAFIHQFTFVKNPKNKLFMFRKRPVLEIMTAPNYKGFKIFGKNIYSVTVREPFKFSTASFKG